MARTCILTYYIVRQTYDIIYYIVCNIYMNRWCLVRIVANHCPYRPCSTPVSSRQQWPGLCMEFGWWKGLCDQQSAPHSPMAHYSWSQDPLASFLSTVPSWSVLDKVALDNAVWGLPVPVVLVGLAPTGILLHHAIKVKIHDCELYYIVYDIVYDIVDDILYNIQYVISYNIVYDIVGIPHHVWKAANQQDLVSGT